MNEAGARAIVAVGVSSISPFFSSSSILTFIPVLPRVDDVSNDDCCCTGGRDGSSGRKDDVVAMDVYASFAANDAEAEG